MMMRACARVRGSWIHSVAALLVGIAPGAAAQPVNAGFEDGLAGWTVVSAAADAAVVGPEDATVFSIFERIPPFVPLHGAQSLRLSLLTDTNESLQNRGSNQVCQTFPSTASTLPVALRLISVDPRGDDFIRLDLFRTDGLPSGITMRDVDTGGPLEFAFPQGKRCSCAAPPCLCVVDVGKQGDLFDSGTVRVLFEGLPTDGSELTACFEAFNDQNSSKATALYVDRFNQPPVAVLPAVNPDPSRESDFHYTDCSESFDPDHDEPLQCEFTITSPTGDQLVLSDTHPAPTLFTIPQDGLATLTLRVTDPEGAFDEVSRQVVVGNQTPFVGFPDVEIEEGGVANLRCRAFDPGHLDPLAATLAADGAAVSPVAVLGEEHDPELGTVAFGADFDASGLAPGAYPLACQVADDDGATIAEATLDVLPAADVPLRFEPANDRCDGPDVPVLAPGRRYRFALAPGDSDCFEVAGGGVGDEIQLTLEADSADLDLVVIAQTVNPAASLLASPLETSPFHPSPFHPSPFHPSPFHPSPLYPSPFHPSPFHPSPFHPSPFHPSPITQSPFELAGVSFESCPLSQCSADLVTNINSKDFSPGEILAEDQVLASPQGFSLKAFSAASGLQVDQALIQISQGELRTFVIVTADDAQPPSLYDLEILASDRQEFAESNALACTGAPLVAAPTTAVEYLCGGPGAGTGLLVTQRERILASQGVSAERWQQLEAALCQLAAQEGLTVASLPGSIFAPASHPAGCDVELCSTECWNAVAEQVRLLVHGECAAQGGCDQVIVLGDDFVLPFLRQPDLTSIGNELGAVDLGLGPGPIAAALHDGFYLTDQHLCDFDRSIPFAGGTFHVADVPCARIVETVDEMEAAIQAYLESGGAVGADGIATAHVDGYQFLADGAQAIAGAFGSGPVAVETLIDDAWTADDAACRALGLGVDPVCRADDYISFQGHMNPTLWLSAAGFGMDNGDVVRADEFALASLDRSALATIGCHSGTNNPDRFSLVCDSGIPCPEGIGGPDIAQSIAAAGGTARLQLGFGLGELDGIAGSEFMDVLLAEAIAGGAATFGEADVQSRRAYVASRGHLDEFDIKIVEQAQLYGFPGRRLGPAAQAAASQIESPQAIAESHAAGVPAGTSTVTVQQGGASTTTVLDLERVTLPVGDYLTFAGDNIAAGPRFRPRGPIFELPAQTPAAGIVHDCVLLGGSVEDIQPWDHVNRGVTFEWNDDAQTPEPVNPNNGFAPGTPCWVNTLPGSAEQRAYLAVSQHDSENGIERVWRDAQLELTESTCAETLDPQVSNTRATALENGDVVLEFDATDASGIARAVVLTNVDGTNFAGTSFDLSAQPGPGYQLTIPGASGNEIKLQVVDACGNALLVSAKSQVLRAFPVRGHDGTYAPGLETTLACTVSGADFASLDGPIVRFDTGDGAVVGGPVSTGAVDVTTDPVTGDVTVSVQHVYADATPDPVEFRCAFTDRTGVNSSGAGLLTRCADGLESAADPDGDWAACSIERTGFQFAGTGFLAAAASDRFQYRIKVTGCDLLKWDDGNVTGPGTVTQVAPNAFRFEIDLNLCGWDGASAIGAQWSTQAGQKKKKSIGFLDMMPDEGEITIP